MVTILIFKVELVLNSSLFTHRGYVSLDYTTSGKTLWRYDNLTTPTLPILDFFGDVIGTNGNFLIKVRVREKPKEVEEHQEELMAN